MKHRLALVATLCSAAVTAAACGGSSDAKQAGSDGLTPVTFAALPVAQFAAVELAEDAGIFEDHGIDLTIEYLEAPAVVPSLMSGDADVGWLSAPAVLVARSNGVTVKAVTTASVAGDDVDSFPIQLMVPADSDIASAADLVGKKVAIDSLYGLPDLGMRRVLAEEGVDPADLDLVEIPFPEMGAALEAGRVDAVLASEPFGTILSSSGAATYVFSASQGQLPGSPQSVVLSSDAFIESNAELVEDFQAAMEEATDYATAHEEELRATLPTFTELPPELADVIRFAPYSSQDDPQGWQDWADVLAETGAVEEPVDATEAYLAD